MVSNKKFTEWKNKAMVILLNLLRKAEEERNEKLTRDLRELVSMLTNLRSRDLHSFLYLVHVIIDYYGLKELYEIIPSVKEIEEMLR